MINIVDSIRPPIQDAPTKEGSKLSDIWFRYFNNLTSTLVNVLQYGISLPQLTTTQRDANAQYLQQRFIINLTTGKVQISLDGATWQDVTLTPA